jgi:hypothetical protein
MVADEYDTTECLCSKYRRAGCQGNHGLGNRELSESAITHGNRTFYGRIASEIFGNHEDIGVSSEFVFDNCVVGLYLWNELFVLSRISVERFDKHDTTENVTKSGTHWS